METPTEQPPFFDFGNPPTQPSTIVLLRSVILNGEHHSAGSEVRLSPAVLSRMTLGEDYDFPPAVR